MGSASELQFGGLALASARPVPLIADLGLVIDPSGLQAPAPGWCGSGCADLDLGVDQEPIGSGLVRRCRGRVAASSRAIRPVAASRSTA